MAKTTKKEMFMIIMKIVKAATVEEETRKKVLDFLDHEIYLLNKKTKATKEKKAAETDGLTDIIISCLRSAGKPTPIKELMQLPTIRSYANGSLSNQKVSAVMTKLKNAGVVTRTENKKVAYFSLAESEQKEDDYEDMADIFKAQAED